MRVAVIGAGFGGLATAIRLLAAGHRVTVVEGRPEPGGRASRICDRGWQFDTGPSLITMPELLDDLFAAAGTSSAQELKLRRLDPFYRISWEGEEETLLFNGDRAAMIEQITAFSLADAGRYDDFMASSRSIHEEAVLVAGNRPFLELGGFLSLVPKMAQLGALRSVDGFVGRFFREPHVRQAFAFHPLFIGGNPFRVPAVYAALAYLQVAGGVWYSEGGMWSLVEALARIVKGGGELRCGDPVTEIVRRNGSAVGVKTASGDFVEAEVVVSNADVVTTRRNLLGLNGRVPRLTMSCFLLYLGVRRKFSQLQHHTLLVGNDYRGFIHDVTVARRLPASLSLYVHAPSRTEPAMAPEGGESISVLLPVPNLGSGFAWSEAEEPLRERVLDMLESPNGLALTGLRDSIEVEHRWTPHTFRDELASPQGNAFGPEPLLWQSAYFRQPNRDRDVPGVYYAGAGTHPGAGIPGVLMTASVTAELIRRDALDGRL
ncbi:MAG: phytoene desaturase family protein [Candidatus Dormibacteraeota bacterium]|nr:phytoene desaturase family protein [Candidatus Dormibacteraeota bacterium]